MKATRSRKTSQQLAGPRWASLAFILVLAAVLSSAALWPRPAQAVFTGGPTVRVIPNTKVEIRWIGDFVGNGKVEVFDNLNGETQIDVKGTTGASTEHRVEFTVGGVIKADTTYFFKITHTDPTGIRPDLTNDPPPYPPFFTGVQAIGDVVVNAGLDSATIAWDANVIGLGRASYGQTSPDELGAVHDQENTTAHSIQLTGLSPGTTYRFRASNHHAIDGDSLAEQTGLFTTQTPVATAVLRQGRAEPRVIDPGEGSMLSVRVLENNQPLAGATVKFEILTESHGGATLAGGGSIAQAISDASGNASMLVQGISRGLVRVEMSSAAAANRVVIPIVVRGS